MYLNMYNDNTNILDITSRYYVVCIVYIFYSFAHWLFFQLFQLQLYEIDLALTIY